MDRPSFPRTLPSAPSPAELPAAGPPRRPPADVEVSLTVHTHADGRQIAVRRCVGDAGVGLTVHIDAVVRG